MSDILERGTFEVNTETKVLLSEHKDTCKVLLLVLKGKEHQVVLSSITELRRSRIVLSSRASGRNIPMNAWILES